MNPASAIEPSLCLSCGLCCSGVLFRNVELQPDDSAQALTALGLPLETHRGKIRLPQPCAALCRDGQCRIYAARPARCRDFDCDLLKAVAAGEISRDRAMRLIQRTRRQAEKVRRLLAALGDHDDTVPLSLRFQRMARRMELQKAPAKNQFHALTVAEHRLNLLLSGSFYGCRGTTNR